MNHKALVISVIFAAALVAGVYSTSTQAALADSVNQKNCHAVVISNSDLCNQPFLNAFVINP